jgi:hypothetical protein
MEETNQEYSFSEVYGNFKKGVKYLASKWMLLCFVAFCSGIIGFCLRWYLGPTYKSTMSFVAENGSSDKLGGYASIAAQFGIDLGQSGGGAFDGDNLLEVFKSRRLIVSTLLTPLSTDNPSELLINRYLKVNKIDKNWSSSNKMKSISFTVDLDKPNRVRDSILNLVSEKIVLNNLSVERKDKKLNFISLEVEDKDEQFAKVFGEKLSENAIKFYTEYKTRKANQNLNLLKTQCDSLKGLLTGSITDAAIISDFNVNPLKQILKSNSQKKQVDIQANTAMYTEVLKQLAIAKITLQKETPLIQVIDSAVLPLKKVNLGKLLTAILFSFFGLFFTSTYLLIKLKIKN